MRFTDYARRCTVCGAGVLPKDAIKWGVRHYAHPECLLEEKGEALSLGALMIPNVRKSIPPLLESKGAKARWKKLIAENDRPWRPA